MGIRKGADNPRDRRGIRPWSENENNVWCFVHISSAIIADSADVWLTVPAAWDARGCDMMREAAITAGLVRNVGARDRDWRDRLRIITYALLHLSPVPFRINSFFFLFCNSVNPRLRQYIART